LDGQTACLRRFWTIAPETQYRRQARPYITLVAMEKKAIRRAALVTLRRAILERFPPGV
jgi:hypothetical protein